MVKKSFIITGPTASGKSDFAHALAKKIDGIIINCDSVQIYRGIENISASPFAERQITDEIDGVPYKLFSILDLSQQISVVDYIKLAKREYDNALLKNKIPIFVGGTGYYINGLVNGVSPIPDISIENRNRARQMVADDFEHARNLVSDCMVTDPQRVARALEVLFETGKSLKYWQSLPRNGAILPSPFKIVINPPVDVLCARIARRIPQMLDGGALDEARAIIKSGWNDGRAIGGRQLCSFLRGEIDKEMAITDWIIKTNQYAKRQRTWFRTQFDADYIIDHVPNAVDIDNIV